MMIGGAMSKTVVRNESDSATATVEHVTQKMITDHLRLKRKLDESATLMLASLKAGATVEEGRGKAYLDEGSTKKPNYRKALVKKLGQEFADRVRRATKRTPYCRLRVEKPA